MKYLNILFIWLSCLLYFIKECHSQVETREYWQNNNRFLLCMNQQVYPKYYFALEMATGTQIPNDEARKMWDSADIKLAPLKSAIAYFKDTMEIQKNTWCAWNNCTLNPDLKLPALKVSFDKDKQAGAVYADKIPGFDDFLKRDRELVKELKKKDKKRSIERWYHTPVLRYDTTHRRIFMVGYGGIIWVSEDSLENGARQVLGEVPGLRLQSVASPQYHRYIFLLYIQRDVKDIWHDEKTICRVFDTHTMQLLKLPDSDDMIDPRFVFCPTGEYVFAVHTRVVHLWTTFSPGLFNLRDWKKESSLQMKGSIEEMRFYLHRKLLYLNTAWHLGKSSVWVLDLSKGEKEIFRYDKQ